MPRGAPRLSRSGRRALVLALGAAAAAGSSVGARAAPPVAESPPEALAAYSRLDLSKVRGAEACGECHVAEHAVWQQTAHETGFKTLHRQEAAEEIAERLGFPLIKRDSVCLRCHYTPELEEARDGGVELRARSGVSCESCHGEAADWIEVHNDYGAGADFASESADHRQMRIERSRAAGMHRVDDVLALGAACFGCHFVTDETLVDTGGHSTGAASFDLWEQTQGTIRHNFLAAQRGGSSDNAERGIERRRELELAGAALSVEYSLRGASRATSDGLYLKAMQRRLRSALAELREVHRRLPADELWQAILAAHLAPVEEGRSGELLAAAEVVRTQTAGLLARLEPAQLEVLDAYLLGRPEPDLPELRELPRRPRDLPPEDERVTDVGAAPEAAAPDATTPGPPGGAVVADLGEPEPEAPVEVVGEKKRRLWPASSHATLGGACSSCHAPQNEWWFGDAHYAAADRLFDETPRALEIASNYGLGRTELLRGDRICTSCHATVVTGKESREVQDGVGCESCHGPGGDYLEPHQQGEKELGDARPGYQAALRLGMTRLADLPARLETCSRCHYVTDERLISSGHPSGADFDYASAMTTIRHWEAPIHAAGVVRDAARAALAARGPVPDVPIRRAPPSRRVRAPLPTTAAADGGANSGGSAPGAAPEDSGSPVGSPADASRSRAPRATAAEAEAEPLQPLEVDPEAPLDELLETLKKRLDDLQRRTPAEPPADPPGSRRQGNRR